MIRFRNALGGTLDSLDVLVGAVRRALVPVLAGAVLTAVAAVGAAQTPAQGRENVSAVDADAVDEPRDEEGKQRFEGSVVVTATRGEREVESLPLSVTVLSREELARAADTELDDVLRSVVGVNLPNGASETQYPSRNTVSLRGLGGRRALVLLDGVPLNDPMFGHVNWNEVPLDSVDRVEVVRGAGASLFGSYAMGGTINILSRPVVDGALLADVSYASYDTSRGSFSLGRRLAPWAAVGVDMAVGRSDGYVRIPEDLRRPIDTPSSWDSFSTRVHADLKLSQAATGFVRGSHASYDLSTGTPYSKTSRSATNLAAGAAIAGVGGGDLRVNLFYVDGDFDTENVRITGDGATGYRSNAVLGPYDMIGGWLQWSRSLGARLPLVTIGADLRRMRSDNHRTNFDSSGAVTSTQDSGGRQDSSGLFVQASWLPAEHLEVLFSTRVDRWRNRDGYNVVSNGADDRFAVGSVTKVSPRLALRYELGGGLGLRAAVYKGFGAPRLTDLYRSSAFRDQENLPNPELTPETMTGGEAGLDLVVPRFRGQLNVFENRIEDLITSVLISSEPLRSFRPDNIGAARSRGVELMGEAYLGERWRLSGGYAFTDSETVDNPANESLEGKRMPYVPRHALSLGVVLQLPGGGAASLRAVYVDEMFADAENALSYDAHTVVDLLGAWPLSSHLEGYLAVTNLLDEEYLDDIAPTTRRGAPRQVRVGVRLRTALPGSIAVGGP